MLLLQAVSVSTAELRKMRQEQGEMSESYKVKKQELDQLLQVSTRALGRQF